MKKLHVSMKTKSSVNGLLFILPWLVGFALFYVRSLYQTVQFSLSELVVPPSGGYELDFVGLANYITAFTGHGTFKQTLVTSLTNMVVDVPLIIFFSLFVAMLLNRKMKCRGLVRAIFFLPVLLNSEAISGTLQFAAQMMAGTGKLALEGQHPAIMKDVCCSPAGTTIQGIRALENGGFRGAVMEAVIAAYERTLELK